MSEDHRHNPSLDDIAFEGRNKDYGSYELRRKYPKYVNIGLITSIVIILLIFGIPFTYYYTEDAGYLAPDELYYVEYYSLSPAPENQEMAPANPAPPADKKQELPPIVSDTVKPLETPKEKSPQPDLNEEKSKQDSVPGGNGNAGQGSNLGDSTGLYTVLDVFPRYPGGDNARIAFLRKNIQYPVIAQKMGLQGVVMIVFIIEKDGSLSNVKVEKGIGHGCDEEAIRVTMAMPRWDPGKRKGNPVRVMVKMPIVFRLPVKVK